MRLTLDLPDDLDVDAALDVLEELIDECDGTQYDGDAGAARDLCAAIEAAVEARASTGDVEFEDEGA